MVKVNFNVSILDIDDKPITDPSDNTKIMTIGRALGNVLVNFRPPPDPQRGGVEVEHYDASRAVELGRKIYKAGNSTTDNEVDLSKGDLNFIISGVLSKVPLSSPLVEDAILSTLKKALNTAT